MRLLDYPITQVQHIQALGKWDSSRNLGNGATDQEIVQARLLESGGLPDAGEAAALVDGDGPGPEERAGRLVQPLSVLPTIRE